MMGSDPSIYSLLRDDLPEDQKRILDETGKVEYDIGGSTLVYVYHKGGEFAITPSEYESFKMAGAFEGPSGWSEEVRQKLMAK